MADTPYRVLHRGSADTLPWRPSSVLLIIGAWMLIASLISGSVLLDAADSKPTDLGIPHVQILLAFIEALIWAGLTCLVFRLVDRFFTERYGHLQRMTIFGACGMAAVVVVGIIMQYLRDRLSASAVNHPFAPISAIGLALEALIYTAVLIAGLARHYLRHFHERLAQATLLQAQLTEARLTTLRAQLNPHFLFNTLHAVSALVGSDARAARRMISQLSALLRIALEDAATPETSVTREIAFARRYLALMSVQLRSRLEIVERLDPASMNGLVPTLILQPLLENAIRHGISHMPARGTLVVEAQRQGDRLHIHIRNSILPGIIERPLSGGVGLHNTRERLQQLYGTTYELITRVDSAAAPEFCVDIDLPFRDAGEANDVPPPRSSPVPKLRHGT